MKRSTVSTNGKEKIFRIVAFGDSITAYRGTLDIASFQIERRMRDFPLPVRIYNSGAPGNTTEMARKRFQRDVIDLDPDLTFIFFGTNDAMVDVFRGVGEPRVSEDAYEQNLTYFVREAVKIGARPVLLSPPPMFMTEELKHLYDGPPYSTDGFNSIVTRYAGIVRRVADREGIRLLDVNKAFWEAARGEYEHLPEFLLDGMHPNERGQTLIAEEMFKILSGEGILTRRSNALPELSVRLHMENSGTIRVDWEGDCARAEYRIRRIPEWENPIPDFGEWKELSEKMISGVAPGQCFFEFRTLNGAGEVLALGKYDFFNVSGSAENPDGNTEHCSERK